MQKIYFLSVLLIGCVACDGVENDEIVDNAERDVEGPDAAPVGAAEDNRHQDDAWSKPASDPVGDVLTRVERQNGGCTCWTKCSSNGVGWTKLYHVGHAANHDDCSGKATAFCLGKSPGYKYHSSHCY